MAASAPTAGYMFPHSHPGGIIEPICSSVLTQDQRFTLIGRARSHSQP